MAGFWNKLPDWSVPEASFYQNFDTSDGLVLWEGTNQTCNVPHVPGKVMEELFSAKLLHYYHWKGNDEHHYQLSQNLLSTILV